MGKAVAEVIGVAAGKDLGLILETAEGAGVDNPVAVALEGVTVSMRRLGEAAATRVLHAYGVAGEAGIEIGRQRTSLE
jgi:hypothetical protein